MNNIKYNCSFCGKEVFKKRNNEYKNIFCNRECHLNYLRSNKQILKTKCNYCDTEIQKTQSQQKHSKTGLFFCDNLCKNRYLAKRKRWMKDDVHNHLQRKKYLFEASNYSCQKCGYNKDKRMFDIHHYDHNHKNNKWSNLRVLCSWCHSKHHRLKEEYIIPILITDEDIKEKIELFNTNRLKKYKKTKYYDNICPFCKKDFLTRFPKQIYCSRSCGSKSTNRMNRRKVKDRPSKEQLLKEISETNYCAVGRKYGVSDNAVRKWIE